MKQPKDMDLNELKILAYDMMTDIQKIQNNLQVVNQMINTKSNENLSIKENSKEEKI